jgi:hypothetical protein
MSIEIVAHVINSKMDVNGNCYFVAELTRVSDNAFARGHVDGGSGHLEYALKQWFGSWDKILVTEEELPIREFNRMVKNWPYLGCTYDEIKANVLKQWNEIRTKEIRQRFLHLLSSYED